LFAEQFRVGEKIISMARIEEVVHSILKLRSEGLSQQEVANALHLDRPFISRLESIGEVRKGKKIALIGFPLQNKEEIIQLARAKGVDYIWVMSEKERWEFVSRRTAMDFFNQVIEMIATLKTYDTIILAGSRKWQKIAEALLDSQIIFLEIGSSPIKEDCFLNPDSLKTILEQVLIRP
jgi:transcriptional regulator with XRE-family HTH domain